MSTRSISGKGLDKAITSDDILGKDVIDDGGRFIGVVEKIFINPATLELMGINIDKGFLKNGVAIGKDYIEKVASHAVFLNINVAYELKGMKVFDSRGVFIGNVADIALEGDKNDIHDLIVSSSSPGLPKRFSISSAVIKNIGYNVLLSTSKDDIIRQINQEKK